MRESTSPYLRLPWLVDELRHAGRENLDPHHVATYDAKEDAGAAAEVELCCGLGLDATSSVIDLGAGTGQFSIAVASRCGHVIAVDVSPLMLDQLEAKLELAGYTNVSVVQAGFLTYEHEGDPVDFVYSRWALHHLGDVWKAIALDRMRQNLRDGGILRLLDIAYSFEASALPDRVERWRAELPETATSDGEWVKADIDEHVRDENSTFTWLLEPMIERAGFRIEQTQYSDDGFFAEYIARAA